MNDFISVKIIILGRVQGVCFRAETWREAINLGLKGYVRNRPDGSVEALFQGSQSAVETALNWCRKGSPAARVDEVIHEPVAFQEDLHDFQIRY